KINLCNLFYSLPLIGHHVHTFSEGFPLNQFLLFSPWLWLPAFRAKPKALRNPRKLPGAVTLVITRRVHTSIKKILETEFIIMITVFTSSDAPRVILFTLLLQVKQHLTSREMLSLQVITLCAIPIIGFVISEDQLLKIMHTVQHLIRWAITHGCIS